MVNVPAQQAIGVHLLIGQGLEQGDSPARGLIFILEQAIGWAVGQAQSTLDTLVCLEIDGDVDRGQGAIQVKDPFRFTSVIVGVLYLSCQTIL